MKDIIQKTECNNTQSNKAREELKRIKKCILEICDALSETECEPREIINMLHQYMIEGERILYSYVSDYIYALSEQKQAQVTTNIEKTYEYTFSEEYTELIEKLLEQDIDKMKIGQLDYAGIDAAIAIEKKKLSKAKETVETRKITREVVIDYHADRIKSAVIKLMDHTNLAIYQYIKLNHDDQYFEIKIGQKAEKLNSEIDKKLNDSSKENMNQLLSLIGIFTALSFMVFGGMTSLDSLFSQIKEVHTLKLVLVGSLWGLVLFDLLAVFEYFVSRVSGKTFKYTNKPNASFYQKYPLVIIGNTVLGTIFLISSWLYFIALEDMGGCYINWVRSCMPILGIGVVVLIIVFMGVIVYILNRKKNINEEENINNEETHTTL